MTLTQKEIDDFRSAIIKNYKERGRVFPWRKTRDAYKILVSEMMLQQTQTLRVVPKYEAWIEAFPDAASLASSPFSNVLAYWNGLGYNRRAKYLHEACREVCSLYGGKFPRERKLLESLPGIGPYTAGAVAAFAFNAPEVFIETNIRSVFIFFFFSNAVEKVSDAEIFPLIEQTLDKTNVREWYWALMRGNRLFAVPSAKRAALSCGSLPKKNRRRFPKSRGANTSNFRVWKKPLFVWSKKISCAKRKAYTACGKSKASFETAYLCNLMSMKN